MINYIELGGQKRPILFGTLAFRWLKNETGMLPADVVKAMTETQDFDVLIQLTAYALRAGQLAEGQKVEPVDADQVALWLDTSGSILERIETISGLIAEAMGMKADDAAADDTKKKKAA